DSRPARRSRTVLRSWSTGTRCTTPRRRGERMAATRADAGFARGADRIRASSGQPARAPGSRLSRLMILVTGGAGFIGANFVLDWLAQAAEPVVNLDKLTYAGNLGNLASLSGDDRHVFVRGDIGERGLVDALLAKHRPRAIVNFAAESHVDRSIHGPAAFIETNVVGTFNLL